MERRWQNIIERNETFDFENNNWRIVRKHFFLFQLSKFTFHSEKRGENLPFLRNGNERRLLKKEREREEKKSMKRFDICIPCPHGEETIVDTMISSFFRLERAPRRWREPIQTERNSTRNVLEYRPLYIFPFFFIVDVAHYSFFFFFPPPSFLSTQHANNLRLHCKFSSFRGMRHVRAFKRSNLQTPRPS